MHFGGLKLDVTGPNEMGKFAGEIIDPHDGVIIMVSGFDSKEDAERFFNDLIDAWRKIFSGSSDGN